MRWIILWILLFDVWCRTIRATQIPKQLVVEEAAGAETILIDGYMVSPIRFRMGFENLGYEEGPFRRIYNNTCSQIPSRRLKRHLIDFDTTMTAGEVAETGTIAIVGTVFAPLGAGTALAMARNNQRDLRVLTSHVKSIYSSQIEQRFEESVDALVFHGHADGYFLASVKKSLMRVAKLRNEQEIRSLVEITIWGCDNDELVGTARFPDPHKKIEGALYKVISKTECIFIIKSRLTYSFLLREKPTKWPVVKISTRWLIEHEIKEDHKFAGKSKSMTDRSVEKFNELIETRESARIAVTEHVEVIGNFGEREDLKQGWGLKSEHITHGLDKTAKVTAEEYFYSQRSLNPPRRADAGFMRRKLMDAMLPPDATGERYLLDYENIPSEKQLTSLFSRLEKTRLKGAKKSTSAKVAKTSKAATKSSSTKTQSRSSVRSSKAGTRKRKVVQESESEETDLDDDVFTSDDEEENDEEILRFHEDDFMKRVIQDEVDEIFDC